MNAPRVSVVLCAHSSDRYPLLVEAVDSVRWQTRTPDEVIVVVDHNPALLDRVTVACPDVTVVTSAGPPGLSGARNTGVATARGEIVVFLDDDAVADADWLAALTAHHERLEVLGVSGYAQPRWETARPRWWPDEFDWVIGCSYRGLPRSTAPVRNLMGCAMSLRRDVIEAVGGFDASLGRTASGAAGCEETELCIRAAECFPHGVFLHEPAARVRHRVPAERSTFRYFLARCRAEGVSKSVVTDRVGAGSGLAAEAAYVRRTLPAGVVRNGLRALRGEVGGALRGAAIGAGLTATTAGFLWAGFRRGRAETSTGTSTTTTTTTTTTEPLPRVEPVLPLVIDTADPPRPLPEFSGAEPYTRASCLLLADGDPIGVREVALDGTETTTADVLRTLDPAGPGVGERSGSRPEPPRPPRGRVRRDTTVAIATRGRPDRLAECLASVAAGTCLPARIVVVDNARPDDLTERMIAGYRVPGCEVRYVREDRPGLAYAHNAALAAVATELVTFTDDDVLAHDRWLEHITRAFDADPETVCVTGMIAPRELETLAQQWVEAQGIYSKGFESRIFDATDNRTDDPMFPFTAGAFGSGANMAFRTDYLRGTGGFDVALGTGTVAMGGDDLAAFYDVIRHGRRLKYVPSAIVLHPHHRDYAALRRQVYGYGAGLGAHLTRCIVHQPHAVVTLVRHRRAATARLAGILHPPRIAGLPDYPRDLGRVQRRGLVTGPARYLLSRYRSRGMSRAVSREPELT